jgi:predicted transcriptional regulator
MEQGELDSVLQVIENPVRRKIMKRLSQEPCYALQLSKELGLGQPLVAKHLAIMEDAGFVRSTREKSPNGPKRRRYALAKRISIMMDFAPNLFLARGVTFSPVHADSRDQRTAAQLSERLRSSLDNAEGKKEKMSIVSEILDEVDARLGEIEQERTTLLAVRDAAMKGAADIVSTFDDLDTKRVLFHVLDEHDRRVESISQSLNLRELAVRMILEELERDLF